MQIDMKPGPYLITILESRSRKMKLKKKDLAADLGITPSTLSSYWTRRAAMPYDLVLKIIKVMDLDKIDTLIKAYGVYNCIVMDIVESEQAVEWLVDQSQTQAENAPEYAPALFSVDGVNFLRLQDLYIKVKPEPKKENSTDDRRTTEAP